MTKGHLDGFTVGLFWLTGTSLVEGEKDPFVHMSSLPCRVVAVSRPGWWHRPVLLCVYHAGFRLTRSHHRTSSPPLFSSPFLLWNRGGAG